MLSYISSKYLNPNPSHLFCIRIRKYPNPVFELKCGKRCYSDLIPYESDPLQSLGFSLSSISSRVTLYPQGRNSPV